MRAFKAFAPMPLFAVALDVMLAGITSANEDAGTPVLLYQSDCAIHAEPLYTYNPAVPSVWYTISPVAGVAMAVRCAAVMRGGRNPLSVADNSRAAEALGLEVPIPTWLQASTGIDRASSSAKYFMRMVL